MKFDLRDIDISQEITTQLKKQYHAKVERMVKSGQRDSKSLNKIRLFHGTSLYELNNILMNGLQTRDTIGTTGNWVGDAVSNPYNVYLTSKWHYAFALTACHNRLYDALEEEKNSGEEIHFDIKSLKATPCYIEVEVREQDLIIDEDFFHSPYVYDKIKRFVKKGDLDLKLTFDECIKNYGTVAHIGSIDRHKIVSFTILADSTTVKMFQDIEGQYMKEYKEWTGGKGLGKLTFLDLLEMEAQHDRNMLNLTYQMNTIPEDKVLFGIQIKEGGVGLQIILGDKEEYLELNK